MYPTARTRRDMRARWNLSRVNGIRTTRARHRCTAKPRKSPTRRPLSIPAEDPQAHDAIRAAFLLELCPQSQTETFLAIEMADLTDKIGRLRRAQEALLEAEIDNLPDRSTASGELLTETEIMALAFRSLIDNSRDLQILERLESILNRRFSSSFNALLREQKLRKKLSQLQAMQQTKQVESVEYSSSSLIDQKPVASIAPPGESTCCVVLFLAILLFFLLGLSPHAPVLSAAVLLLLTARLSLDPFTLASGP